MKYERTSPETEKLILKFKTDLESAFFSVGIPCNEYDQGMVGQLISEAKQIRSPIENSKVINLTVGRIGKEKRRFAVPIIMTFKIPRNLTKNQKRYLNTQRVRNIFGIRIVSKTVIEICKLFYLPQKGSRTGFDAGSVSYLPKTGWNLQSEQLLPVIKNSEDLRKQKIDSLIEVIGKDAVNALQKGTATLKVWRRSQPFNWFVSSKPGKYLWHSNGGEHPSLANFVKVEDSKEIISVQTFFFNIPGNNQPEMTTYALNPSLIETKKK